MTLGFTEAFGHVFKPIWANDHNRYAVASYNANFGDHCVLGDIVDILQASGMKIPKADVVIGGPPAKGSVSSIGIRTTILASSFGAPILRLSNELKRMYS